MSFLLLWLLLGINICELLTNTFENVIFCIYLTRSFSSGIYKKNIELFSMLYRGYLPWVSPPLPPTSGHEERGYAPVWWYQRELHKSLTISCLATDRWVAERWGGVSEWATRTGCRFRFSQVVFRVIPCKILESKKENYHSKNSYRKNILCYCLIFMSFCTILRSLCKHRPMVN